MKNPIKIAPSILSADFAKLYEAIQFIDSSQADWVHIDIMDGVFVPNLTFGMPIIEAIRPYTSKVFDVHLMIVEPQRYIKDFKKAGADILTVHYEASTHLHRTLQAIKDEGMKAGVALNPHTPVSLLKDVITDIDLVIMMSVNPGFAAQKFIENTYHKTIELKELILKKNASTLIEIDGGVSLENYHKLIDSGADVLVAGNAIFKADNPNLVINTMKS